MVYFIPGLFSGPIHYLFGTYFVDQFEYLKKLGVKSEVVPLNSEKTLEENAEFIKNFLEDKDEVIFITHSKGGTDLLHAIIIYPELHSKIKRIVFIQAPFFGTPLVRLIKKMAPIELLTKSVLKILKGSWISMDELSIESRTKYMNDHFENISEITKKLDITCVGSKVDFKEHNTKSVLAPLINYLNNKKMAGDGIVPFESTKLLGAKNITVDGMDHSSLVVRRTLQNFDRTKFTEFILENNLERGNHEYQIQ